MSVSLVLYSVISGGGHDVLHVLVVFFLFLVLVPVSVLVVGGVLVIELRSCTVLWSDPRSLLLLALLSFTVFQNCRVTNM